MKNQKAFEIDYEYILAYAKKICKIDIYKRFNLEPIDLVSIAFVECSTDYTYERDSFKKEVVRAANSQTREPGFISLENVALKRNKRFADEGKVDNEMACFICKKYFHISEFYFNKRRRFYIRYCKACKNIRRRFYNKTYRDKAQRDLTDTFIIIRLKKLKKYNSKPPDYFRQRPSLIIEYRKLYISKKLLWNATKSSDRAKSGRTTRATNLSDSYIRKLLFNANRNYTASYVRRHPNLIKIKREQIVEYRAKKKRRNEQLDGII